MIATVDRVAPNFSASVLGRRVLSPLDLEREFGLTGGDIFHGALGLDQLFSAAAGARPRRLPDAGAGAVPVRRRRASRRRRHRHPGPQCRARNPARRPPAQALTTTCARPRTTSRRCSRAPRATWPRLPAVASGAQVCHDYAALALRASRLADALTASGLQPGDRVALVSRNVPEYVETLFACWWAGLIAVPVNAKLHPTGAGVRRRRQRRAMGVRRRRMAGGAGRRRCRRSNASSSSEAPSTRRCWPMETRGEPAAVDADAAAWLFYTSGTTGRPKGVVITHANLRAMTQCFLSDVEAIAPGDAILHAAPLSHGSGLYVVPHVARGAVNVVPASGGFDAAEIVALLRHVRPHAVLRRADDGQAARRRAGDRRGAARPPEVHRLRRRSDVRRRLPGRRSPALDRGSRRSTGRARRR